MNQCSKKVYPNDRMGSFHGYQCHFKAVVIREGKPYCKIHDPVKVEEKRREREKGWEIKWEKSKSEYRRLKVMTSACEDVETEILETIKIKDLLGKTK